MKRFVLTTLLVLALPLSTALSFDDESEIYSFGHVIKATADTLILKEADFENNEGETEVSYIIDQETIFENFKKISELLINDEVEISFVEENGVKRIRRIAKIFGYHWDYDEVEVDPEKIYEETLEDSRV